MFEKASQIITFGAFYDFKQIQRDAVHKWGKDVRGIIPTFFPGKRIALDLHFLKPKRNDIRIIDCQTYIEENKLLFPNVFGLIIVEALDHVYNFIKPGDYVIGFDSTDSLPSDDSGLLLPCLQKKKKISYDYFFLPMGGKLEHDERIVAFSFSQKDVA